MNSTSGAASIIGVKVSVFRIARVLARIMSAPEVRGPEGTTASDKDRVRDRPGDLDPLAGGPPARGGARPLLQPHRRAAPRLQHVAAALAGEHRLGHGDAQSILL